MDWLLDQNNKTVIEVLSIIATLCLSGLTLAVLYAQLRLLRRGGIPIIQIINSAAYYFCYVNREYEWGWTVARDYSRISMPLSEGIELEMKNAGRAGATRVVLQQHCQYKLISRIINAYEKNANNRIETEHRNDTVYIRACAEIEYRWLLVSPKKYEQYQVTENESSYYEYEINEGYLTLLSLLLEKMIRNVEHRDELKRMELPNLFLSGYTEDHYRVIRRQYFVIKPRVFEVEVPYDNTNNLDPMDDLEHGISVFFDVMNIGRVVYWWLRILDYWTSRSRVRKAERIRRLGAQ